MRILVTGGTSGLGKAIVEELSSEFEVFFTYHRNSEVAKELEKVTNTTSIQYNMSDTSSVESLCNWIVENEPDILVNNALTGFVQKHAYKISGEEHHNAFEENIASTITLTNRFIKKARKRKSGRIINVLSSYIIGKPPVGMSQYVAQKNYLLSLNKSWAIENIAFGITSNAISPSIMKTNLTKDTDERIFEQLVENSPMKRLIEPKEVSEVISFIIKATPFLNGQNIVLNHGENLI